MEFYTKLGIAATTITVIVLLVLWGMGYFSSPELSYVITPETATAPLTPFATAGSNIITMKSDGDFELVPVVNVNTPINEARTQRNQMRTNTTARLNTLATNAQSDAQSRVDAAKGPILSTLNQHNSWINDNEGRAASNLQYAQTRISQSDGDERYVKLGSVPGGQYNIKLYGNHRSSGGANAWDGDVTNQYLYADNASQQMKRGFTGDYSSAQFTFH